MISSNLTTCTQLHRDWNIDLAGRKTRKRKKADADLKYFEIIRAKMLNEKLVVVNHNLLGQVLGFLNLFDFVYVAPQFYLGPAL